MEVLNAKTSQGVARKMEFGPGTVRRVTTRKEASAARKQQL